jgi:hypothetical protein
MHRAAVDAIAHGDVTDLRAVIEDLTRGEIALLNHRQLRKHRPVLPRSTARTKTPERRMWNHWDTGAGATVAKEPEPGRETGQRSRT